MKELRLKIPWHNVSKDPAPYHVNRKKFRLLLSLSDDSVVFGHWDGIGERLVQEDGQNITEVVAWAYCPAPFQGCVCGREGQEGGGGVSEGVEFYPEEKGRCDE